MSGDVKLREAAINAQSAKYTADKSYQQHIDVKRLVADAEAPKQQAKADATTQVNESKENLKSQSPLST